MNEQLFETLAGIIRFFSEYVKPAGAVEVCLCCHRTKSGIFLETHELPDRSSYIRFWSPWGGIAVGVISPLARTHIHSLVLGTSVEAYTVPNIYSKLYPIRRDGLPPPMLFEGGEEKDDQEVRLGAREWQQLAEALTLD